MQHFGEADYEIEEAIAQYHGTPYVAKNCQCWDGYERVPGTKPCAPGSCRKCDEGCHKKKKSSQGDKPSPHAAQAVLAALESGNEEEAKELLKKTDCPEGCETHPEGKCNHQYMSAGRTRVRYLINDSSFDESTVKESGIMDKIKNLNPRREPTTEEMAEFTYQNRNNMSQEQFDRAGFGSDPRRIPLGYVPAAPGSKIFNILLQQGRIDETGRWLD